LNRTPTKEQETYIEVMVKVVTKEEEDLEEDTIKEVEDVVRVDIIASIVGNTIT
jgi:hypothetical protein